MFPSPCFVKILTRLAPAFVLQASVVSCNRRHFHFVFHPQICFVFFLLICLARWHFAPMHQPFLRQLSAVQPLIPPGSFNAWRWHTRPEIGGHPQSLSTDHHELYASGTNSIMEKTRGSLSHTHTHTEDPTHTRSPKAIYCVCLSCTVRSSPLTLLSGDK